MRRFGWFAFALALPLAGLAHDVPCTIPEATAAAAPAVPAVADTPDAAPAAPAADAMAAASAAAPGGPLRLRPVNAAKPRMPDAACQLRLAGSVDLDFVVLPDGSVAQVVVTASDPKGVFDATAIAAVSESTYPPQAKPIKMRQRMLLNSSDCRSEQLRTAAALAEATPASQVDCLALAGEAKTAGERFEAADAGRAVLQGDAAQTFWAPNPGCPMKGRTLKPGTRLTAHMEFRGFSLVSAKGGEEAAVWVRSNQLKDVQP